MGNQQIAVLRPKTEIASLKALLSDPVKLSISHSPRYNLIARPFFGPWQNSNGWLLEVFARANDRNIWSQDDARRWLQRKGYQASVVNVSVFERLEANLFAANIFSDDQPEELLREGKPGLNTGDR